MNDNQLWMKEQGYIQFPDGVMELLNCGQRTAYNLRQDGAFESIKIAGKNYVLEADITVYIQREATEQIRANQERKKYDDLMDGYKYE